jgi:hypothetical protein
VRLTVPTVHDAMMPSELIVILSATNNTLHMPSLEYTMHLTTRQLCTMFVNNFPCRQQLISEPFPRGAWLFIALAGTGTVRI